MCLENLRTDKKRSVSALELHSTVISPASRVQDQSIHRLLADAQHLCVALASLTLRHKHEYKTRSIRVGQRLTKEHVSLVLSQHANTPFIRVVFLSVLEVV